MKKSFRLIIFITMLFLVSCAKFTPSPKYTDLTDQVKITALQFPDEKFSNVIWQLDGTIAVFTWEIQRPFRQPYAIAGDEMLRYLDLEQDIENCSSITWYGNPTQLPDGRIGFLKDCVTGNAFTTKMLMVAYDWKTKKMEQIVEDPLMSPDRSACFSWNMEMTKAIQRNSDGMVNSFKWVTINGPEPIQITLQANSKSWDMSKDFGTVGTSGSPLASCPAWSPNNNDIALFVSFETIGMDGFSRFDQPYSLILLNDKTAESKIIFSGFYSPHSIKWSDDGNKLAFIASSLSNQNWRGLWVFDFETKTLYLVSKGNYYDLSWSPDSRQIVAILCKDEACQKTGVYLLALPAIP